MNLTETISDLEKALDRIHAEWPEFSFDSLRVVGDESLLDELLQFVANNPEIESEKATITQFSVSGGSFIAAVLKAKHSVSTVGVALLAFVGLRKCRLTLKLKGQEISVEAASAQEMERLLRVADELFIHPFRNDRNG